MPLGLAALVAAGVHAAADRVDDHLLKGLLALDAWADGWLARWDWTAAGVRLVEAREATLAARALALAWELAVDAFLALPLLGVGPLRLEAWQRLRREPTPMRVLRPLETAVFALGGSYAVARLVEATLFQGLSGGVAPAAVASGLARGAGLCAMLLVLATHGTRAVWGALQHADQACARPGRTRRATAELPRVGPALWGPWLTGAWGTALALPLALALALDARAWLAVLL